MPSAAALLKAEEARRVAIAQAWEDYDNVVETAGAARRVALSTAEAAREAAVDRAWAAYEVVNGGDA